MRHEVGVLTMEDNTKNKKKNQLLVSPNPIAMASAGLSGAGTLMPDAIHGVGIAGESIKKESSIDYPASEGLCEDIWDAVGDSWTMKSDIKDKALKMVNLLLQHYKVKAKGVNVVGSLCSN